MALELSLTELRSFKLSYFGSLFALNTVYTLNIRADYNLFFTVRTFNLEKNINFLVSEYL